MQANDDASNRVVRKFRVWVSPKNCDSAFYLIVEYLHTNFDAQTKEADIFLMASSTLGD